MTTTAEPLKRGDYVTAISGPFACRLGTATLVSDDSVVVRDEEDGSLFAERLEWVLKVTPDATRHREPARVPSTGALKR